MTRSASIFAISALFAMTTIASSADAPAKQWVYVGTYTNAKTGSKGIYRFEFDSVTGKLTPAGLAAEALNPSFLAIHPDGKCLLAVSELSDPRAAKGVRPPASPPETVAGRVCSFRIDPASGKLAKFAPNGEMPTRGDAPCHLSFDRTGKYVFVVNYGSGTIAYFDFWEAGKFASGKYPYSPAFFKDAKFGPNAKRQEGWHPHSINLDPANRFAIVADLGADSVTSFPFDAATGELSAAGGSQYKTAPGAGPRHLTFHPDGKRAFVINELNSTLSLLNYDAEKGALTEKETLSTLPPGFTGENWPAEVVVHPSGKFVYGSNRGHNSIVAFAIEPEGKLKLIGHQGDGVKTPRNFNIDQSGQWMIVANQDANNLVVFKIDQQSGVLSPTGVHADVGGPVCVKFMAAPK